VTESFRRFESPILTTLSSSQLSRIQIITSTSQFGTVSSISVTVDSVFQTRNPLVRCFFASTMITRTTLAMAKSTDLCHRDISGPVYRRTFANTLPPVHNVCEINRATNRPPASCIPCQFRTNDYLTLRWILSARFQSPMVSTLSSLLRID
jgi:hypothetical protein